MCPGSERPGVDIWCEASSQPECREGETVERIPDAVEQAVRSSDPSIMVILEAKRRDLGQLKCVATSHPREIFLLPSVGSREVRTRSPIVLSS